MPTTARSTHSAIRTTPSEPRMIAYSVKRPLPEHTPRARCAGAYAANAAISAITMNQSPSKYDVASSGLIARIAKVTTATRTAPRLTTLRTTGRAPSSAARRYDSARPSSCSSGRKKPGASAKVANHIDAIGANASSPPTATLPTLKNA